MTLAENGALILTISFVRGPVFCRSLRTRMGQRPAPFILLHYLNVNTNRMVACDELKFRRARLPGAVTRAAVDGTIL